MGLSARILAPLRSLPRSTPPAGRRPRSGSSPFLLLLLLSLPSLPCRCSAQLLTGVPYQQCVVPPAVLPEATATTVQSVYSLCIKTNVAMAAYIETATSFFIGNSSLYRDFGTACYDISLVYNAVLDPSTGLYTFPPAPQLPPEFSQQSWELSLWPEYDPTQPQQKVNLTVNNFGLTRLQLTGIDYKELGLPANFEFGVGNASTLEVLYDKVQLTFDTLPMVEQYLLNPQNNQLTPGDVSALVFFQTPEDVTSSSITITYVLVNYTSADPTSDFHFVLYESTYSLATTSSKGRKLLVVQPKNKAPASACPSAKCIPNSPLPAKCKVGAATYPACLKKCTCFVSQRAKKA